MPTRLPPLTWLRAFEAAGRLQSFRGAAAELHVTPSAISHHIRALERHLGRPLFQRAGNRVRLTREGEQYLGQVSAGFAQLAGAAQVLETESAAPRLTLGAFPFLVSEVLLPALAQLRTRLPGTTISVVSGTQLPLLTHPDPAQRVDALVRYGNGRFPGYHARKLTDVTLLPIAASDLLAAAADRRALVAGGPRISVAGPFDGWSEWSKGTGIALDPAAERLSFDSYLAAMRAVEQGLGVGLGLRPFVDPWLAAGRVAVALEQPVAVAEGSYLVTAGHAAGRRELDVLTSWLLERFASGCAEASATG